MGIFYLFSVFLQNFHSNGFPYLKKKISFFRVGTYIYLFMPYNCTLPMHTLIRKCSELSSLPSWPCEFEWVSVLALEYAKEKKKKFILDINHAQNVTLNPTSIFFPFSTQLYTLK